MNSCFRNFRHKLQDMGFIIYGHDESRYSYFTLHAMQNRVSKTTRFFSLNQC